MIPYIGFGNDTLDKMPKVLDNDPIICPKCGGVHRLQCSLVNGVKDNFLMFFACGDNIYIGAVKGRLVADIKPDISGSI